MRSQLSNIAIVTGASRGIGSAIAHELKQQGWRVIGTATDVYRPELQDCPFVDEWWSVDFSNNDETHNFCEKLEQVPNLGALISNAGINIIKPQTDVTSGDLYLFRGRDGSPRTPALLNP